MRTKLHLAVTAAAVAAFLGFQGNPDAHRVFADVAPSTTMEALQQRLVQLAETCENIRNTADAERRGLSPEEHDDIKKNFAAFHEIEEEIKRREEVDAMRAQVSVPNTRQTQAEVPPTTAQTEPAAQNTSNTPAPRAASRNTAPYANARTTNPGNWGFRSAGEYINAVFRASARGAVPDPRLIANAPTTFGQEGVGADGGFAVPPDFRSTIIKKVAGEDSLLGLTDQQTTSSNTITFPVDETTPWQSSGGIQVYWENEAGQKQQSKPQLKEVTVKANKIICLVPMTDELLQDAPAMTSWLNSKVPEHIDYAVNAALIRGSGVGQPLGILNSNGLVTVAAESGQTADTVVFENIVKLYTRMPASSKRNAVWLINEDIEAQLMSMSFPGSGTAVPVYLPPGGLSAQPYATLFGRPVMPIEAASALGDVGDIIFADMKKYMTLVKGGLKQDVSIHLFFDYDISCFRFVLRIGGQPWFNSAITRANGTSRGFFTTLAAR